MSSYQDSLQHVIDDVVAPGAAKRAVRPPAGADWIDPWTGAKIAGGRMAVLDAPLGRPVILARRGSLIPVNRAPAKFGEATLDLGFLLFPSDEGEVSIELFADDGESAVDTAQAPVSTRITVASDATQIEVTVWGILDFTEAAFILPPGETRRLSLTHRQG